MTTPTHGQSLSSWMEEGSGSGVSLTGNITDNYPEYFGGVSHQPIAFTACIFGKVFIYQKYSFEE